MRNYMNLLHYNPCKSPTCFDHLLWPSTGIFLDVVLICTCCFYSHTFEVCNYNYYHKKYFTVLLVGKAQEFLEEWMTPRIKQKSGRNRK